MRPRKRIRRKRGGLVRAPKSPEVRYRRELNVFIARLRKDTASAIVPVLRAFESEYVNDGYATTLEDVFNRLRMSYVNVGREAKIVASSFVGQTNQSNKERFYKAMNNAVGVDLSNVVQNEGLDDILVASTQENVALIRSIPEEYFKKIETAIYTGTTQGTNLRSLIQEINAIGKTTQSRSKLIARDQTSKINSSLNQQRQQNLGVEEYVWRTSGDSRVRADHAAHNGKTFRWDSPPKDTGHPGNDIQCRCIAQPIIEI